MPSMSLLSVGTASAMDMPRSVPLHQGHQPTPRAWYEALSGWSRARGRDGHGSIVLATCLYLFTGTRGLYLQTQYPRSQL